MNKYSQFTKEEIASWPSGHKRCRTCREVLPFEAFHKHKQALMGYAVECKLCRKPASKEQYSTLTFERRMYDASKSRARKYGIPHTITVEDIFIPEVCPVLGVPIILEKRSPYAPSLDQINPRGGYTIENIRVISTRANILKNNMTVEEARMIYEDLLAV